MRHTHKTLFPPLPALALAAAVLSTACGNGSSPTASKVVTPVDFSRVTIDDGFWSPRLQRHKSTTLPVCIDQIENKTGRIRNFENAALGRGEHSGIFFDDSDVYKALEGMAYSLVNNPDPVLEAKCDEWIAKFAAAQQPDGYINTFYTLTGLENRWTDMDRHEMYCAGHLGEAAVAYYKATGKRTLLDVALRMADHMMNVFGPGKRDWVPGHEEVELSLVKLYEVSGERKYLDFANWLLDERGHGHGSFGDSRKWNPIYYQDEVPVTEATDISGHAVRATYLYCGMADIAAHTGNQAYRAALDRLWDDVALRNMYITGGIGQSASNEGFTNDYSLPNKSAYCETCASVGLILWNWRMNQMTGDSKYIDVLEKSLYNAALSGISIAGDKFFYVNPLESDGGHHRQSWYGCACCPSQICRFLPSIGNYLYGTDENGIWVNLYIGSKADILPGIVVSQQTHYPWDGHVEITLRTKKPLGRKLHLRIPSWCTSFTVTNSRGEAIPYEIKDGYAVLQGPWKDGDKVLFDMDMTPIITFADPRVKEDEGLCAVQRGPIIYCMEGIDNKDTYTEAAIGDDTTLEAVYRPDELGGIVRIEARTKDGKFLSLIPYYSWDNREATPMKVWIKYDGEGAPS